jgi:hypothetical protein
VSVPRSLCADRRQGFNDGQRFESIDRLEMNANDGDPTTWDYFGFDDLTFFPGIA